MKKNEGPVRTITEEAIENYCRWLQCQEKSNATVKRYRYYLEQFMLYMDGKSLSKESVILWKSSMRERMAPVTVNGALAALNGFFKYLGRPELCAKFYKISNSVFCPEQKELTKEEYKRLVRAAKESKNERLMMILQTICSSGIRISELPYITVEAVQCGVADVDCKGRNRKVFLTKKLCELLKKYTVDHNITSGMIFISRTGRALDRSNIWRDMKALGQLADVPEEKIFPHNLRHLFARSFYSLQKDLSRLADILGHSDVNTTRIYTRESGNVHVKILEQLDLLVTQYNGIPLLL